MLPHERYEWIDSRGRIGAGTFLIEDPIVVPPGYTLSGQGRDTTLLMCARTKTSAVVLDGGTIEGAWVRGGRLGVEIKNNARDSVISDCLVSQAAEVQIYNGPSFDTQILRTLIVNSPDNGYQDEASLRTLIHSCAFVGTFGNRAIDSAGGTHGFTRGMRLVHCTVVTKSNYGVNLPGWKVGAGNSMTNCAVFVAPPGPGSEGFAINLPNAGVDDSFVGNVVQGTVHSANGALGWPKDAIRQGANLLPNGAIAVDLPKWGTSGLPLVDQLRPGLRGMFRGSWRTLGSRDLNGELRVWEALARFSLKPASGAMAWP